MISTENDTNHRPARYDTVAERIRAAPVSSAARMPGGLVGVHHPDAVQLYMAPVVVVSQPQTLMSPVLLQRFTDLWRPT